MAAAAESRLVVPISVVKEARAEAVKAVQASHLQLTTVMLTMAASTCPMGFVPSLQQKTWAALAMLR